MNSQLVIALLLCGVAFSWPFGGGQGGNNGHGGPGSQGGPGGQSGPGGQGGPGGNNGGHGGFPTFPPPPPPPFFPPFLQNVSLSARIEFFKLVANSSLSKAELKSAVAGWAEEQGGDIPQEVEAYEQQLKAVYDAFQANVAALIEPLSGVFEQLKAIHDNEEISLKEDGEQSAALIKALDKKLQKIVILISSLAVPRGPLHSVPAPSEGPQPSEGPEPSNEPSFSDVNNVGAFRVF